MDERLYQKFSYARGYLLTSVPAPPPKPDWASVEVAGLHLSYDRRLPYARAQASKHWGYKDAARATVAILARCRHGYLRRSADAKELRRAPSPLSERPWDISTAGRGASC